jgi:hypothetical protein
MLKKRAGLGRLIEAAALLAFALVTSACSGPDVAADKANSTGGSLGTGMGALGHGDKGDARGSGAFAPATDPAKQP